MVEGIVLRRSPLTLGAPGTPPYSGGDVEERTAHALILVPSLPEAGVTWYPLARFILSWQVRWLRQAGIFVTFVMDDIVPLSSVLDSQMANEDDIDILTWDGLARLPGMSPANGMEAKTIIAMRGPLLMDCDLAQLLAAHQSSGRAVTAVRQRASAGGPVAYMFSPQYIATDAAELKSSLRTYSSQPGRELTFSVDCGVVRADCEVLVQANRRELLRLERLWQTCAPRAGLIPVPDHPAAFCTVEEPPALAATAHVHGPVVLGANVVVGKNASIGPWVLLESNCRVSRDVWVEVATIGAGTIIERESCVYASVTEPQTQVLAGLPLLKAYLSILHTSPLPLPSAPSAYEASHSYRIAKRLMDIVGAALALLVTAPILCCALVLCWVAQGWPVFFVHERSGMHGERLSVLKLRTMRRTTDHDEYLQELVTSPRFKLTNDNRVTRPGRFLRRTSLDELPQLFNVLVGNMALVGPRPIAAKELIRRGVYASDLARVKPGLTGLWQVNGRSTTTYARRIMLDTQYADQRTLWLDVAILLRTLPAVMLQRGAE